MPRVLFWGYVLSNKINTLRHLRTLTKKTRHICQIYWTELSTLHSACPGDKFWENLLRKIKILTSFLEIDWTHFVVFCEENLGRVIENPFFVSRGFHGKNIYIFWKKLDLASPLRLWTKSFQPFGPLLCVHQW